VAAVFIAVGERVPLLWADQDGRAVGVLEARIAMVPSASPATSTRLILSPLPLWLLLRHAVCGVRVMPPFVMVGACRFLVIRLMALARIGTPHL